MCRLFGFRSVIKSRMHRSLVSADNALVHQSEHHPDGWGVAYYKQGVPHLIKTADTAVADSIFQRVSGVVSSETVVAHLRKATVGELSMINSHPFQHGRWVFAHNGGIPEFEEYRDELRSMIFPKLRSFILGDTDSEVIFYYLLSNMKKRFDIQTDDPPVEGMVEAIRETVDTIRAMTGIDCYSPPYDDVDLFMSFLITDGQTMFGHQGGKELHFSTHKQQCPERDVCSSFGDVCEEPAASGKVNHLLVSSEPLEGENVWREMPPRQTVAVDREMNLSIYQDDELVDERQPEPPAEAVSRAV